MKQKKIILDTDIGDDIDDALALMMLLENPTADLLGITTVYKNTERRARLAKKILAKAQRNDLKVWTGSTQPLEGKVDAQASFCQDEEELSQACYASDAFPGSAPGEAAVDFLVQAARQYGSELTLIAIGPYTNVAKAYQKDPEAMRHLGEIVLMGGCFYEQFIEYNVAMDPLAAQILFQGSLPLRVISADVTWKAQLNAEETSRLLAQEGDDLSGYAATLIRLWKKSCWFNPVLHDPLAVYATFYPEICSYEAVWTEVDCSQGICRGMTLNRDHCFKYLEHPLERPRILVTKSVEASKFVAEFMRLFLRRP